jgi:hypothetical protein
MEEAFSAMQSIPEQQTTLFLLADIHHEPVVITKQLIKLLL